MKIESKHTVATWYEGSTGTHQGLIIENGTGKNIAVTYDKADAPLIAAAPELLNTLKNYVDFFSGYVEYEYPMLWKELATKGQAAISKAEKGE